MGLFSKAYWNRYHKNYVLISWLFLRGLALIYFAAFASMAIQIEGLVGSNGILPVTDKLALLELFYSEQRFWRLPTIFWFDASDTMLISVCYIGMAFTILLLFNLFTRFSLFFCYILYLSIVKAGQEFTAFQWDTFLLETGFLALFLTWGSGITILLFRWLIARFMFMGGIVKIASGDSNWVNLTALSFYYETQPLPTPLAYYAHHLPIWFHKLCVGSVFFIELIVPFFLFLPRRFRIFACYAFILLQCGIMLTGNYTFFNVLVILLCLFLLEDKDVVRMFPSWLCSIIQGEKPRLGSIAHVFSGIWAGLVILVCISHLWLYHINVPLIDPLKSLLRVTSAFNLVNNYGPFSVMTTKRNEIIVQGSNDALHWSNYEFKYKPDELNHNLSWNIPHQPRLDWQMWFVALRAARKDSWFDKFQIRLLQGSPQVLSLLDKNPFSQKPPVYVRALSYRYSYTTLDQHDYNGQYWKREYMGFYWPARRLISD
nr:lipase maturation factor family protein [Rhodospirillales bacterium]